ncbi:hypothetical protein [Elizabethkingia miricola]|uniref:hypothetical protein n=1 Tax=Elizabethkingia miricola TaxID=172045 RepID=UPI000B35C780|nr:hypothetical protein [Elizabethkingia miricola]NHQ68739.1 hypothetical protein [Elizabethkingia miricola]NHQ72427.1 hypothetical protein [Elizabethkingia miricola]NHQ79263.1 hypothetical protein [Elizabethkingia miricola]PSL86753.1 hypothetical protein C7V10_18925 [Elizabethkingia miricola]QHQ87984.1 hypothetical protein FE632_14780 [Elizabethkingia miricola]
MKRYDKVQNTNISGLNNTIVINNLTASITKRPLALTLEKGDTYVEFNIRTEMITEENGDKSIIYPKVRGNKVIGLVEAVLTKQETHMSYYTYNSESSLYKDYKDDFQDALDRYQNRRQIRLSALIKPMADTEIEGVVITVKRKKKEDIGTVRPPEEGGSCPEFANCIAYNPGGGGGNDMPSPEIVDKIDISDLKTYPCAFAIAEELPKLNNDLGTVLNKIFKNSDKYNINFKISKILDATSSTDGKTQPSDFKKEDDKFTATIFLNKAVLENATKEYILVTMYHEVVHAYLDFELYRLGQQEFSLKYPGIVVDRVINTFDEAGKKYVTQAFVYYSDHTEAGAYIGTLEKIIKEYNPNLSAETAKILAKSGMMYLTPDEVKINERERGIDKTLGQSEGTKCTN